jgi:hypothetical protein
MNEVVTVLTSASVHSLVKSFRGPDLTKQNFSIGNLFQIVEEQVSDLKSLSNVLQRLGNEPTHTIIRGSLVDGQTGPVRRNKGVVKQSLTCPKVPRSDKSMKCRFETTQ